MGVKFLAARAVSSLSTWGLKHIFRRPAANFPGKMALYVDANLIGDLRPKLTRGCVVVVGTNGKTTVANLIADVLERAGQRVVCNRTGANLDSGVATALLHAQPCDWGVFETDELWLAKILPYLQADYVLLLNLFQDQLDRVGEIEHIQDSITEALATSPQTVLVYNADDPLCVEIAERAENPSIAFGSAHAMKLLQDSTAMVLCRRCSSPLNYSFRQYGQLGKYRCPECGFSRPPLNFAIDDISLGAEGLSFSLNKPQQGTAKQQGAFFVRASCSGAYMVYNLAAVGVMASLLGCSEEQLQKSIDAFNPQNGRLQSYEIDGHAILLNLAKNPTGFNQNIEIVLQDPSLKVVAFFVNDKEGDGRDVSWLWDVNFEALATGDTKVYAGGIRRNEVQVRLKYAGLTAPLISGVADLFASLQDMPQMSQASVYLIANYTALPCVRADMNKLQDLLALSCRSTRQTEASALQKQVSLKQRITEASCQQASQRPLVIAHLFPDLLNLYGDGGNVSVLKQRANKRGIPVEVIELHHGDSMDLSLVDLVFFCGGTDSGQRLAQGDLLNMRDSLCKFVEDGGVVFVTGGGFPLLGTTCLIGTKPSEGIGLVDMVTENPTTSKDRLSGVCAVKSPFARMPVVGYENHWGRTHLGEGLDAFGVVIGSVCASNNDDDRGEGLCYRNVVGTYLHGSVLAKNPEVADALLERALKHRFARCKEEVPELFALDDAVEVAANEYICKKLGVSV